MKFTKRMCIAAVFLVCMGCGNEGAGPAKVERRPAVVELSPPPTEIAADFWAGVETRVLLWRPNGGAAIRELPLTGTESENVDLSRGGQLEFEGRSETGAVLVTGYAFVEPWDPAVGQPKVILISLRRRG